MGPLRDTAKDEQTGGSIARGGLVEEPRSVTRGRVGGYVHCCDGDGSTSDVCSTPERLCLSVTTESVRVCHVRDTTHGAFCPYPVSLSPCAHLLRPTPDGVFLCRHRSAPGPPSTARPPSDDVWRGMGVLT